MTQTTTLTVPVLDPTTRAAGLAQLRKDRTEAEQLLATVPAWTPDFAVAVGSILIQALRTHDALQAERDRIVMPIHAAYKNASETYAADLKESKALCDALKAAVGAYETAQHLAKVAALAQAQEAVRSGDGSVLGPALALVNAAPARAEGVGSKLVWQVKRYLPDLMLPSTPERPGLVPDESGIKAYAKAHTSQDPSDPPVLAGVVFELTAAITGRRQ